MTVFAFRSSNEFLGKFNIESLAELGAAFSQFASDAHMKPHDYLECGSDSWTVVEGGNGLVLQEGRFTVNSEPIENTESLSDFLMERYYLTRNMSFMAIRSAGMVLPIGWLIGIIIVLFGTFLSYSGSLTQSQIFAQILPWLILGISVGLIFHCFSVIMETLGRLLGTSLDTTINTSSHLGEEEKHKALGRHRFKSADSN